MLEGQFGRTVHALVYPPANPDVTPPADQLPPYVVWVHGGPTSHVMPLLDIEKAYFTSRGIGIVDVNYGGSTGYGRRYRERLRRQWGVVDVEDAIAPWAGWPWFLERTTPLVQLVAHALYAVPVGLYLHDVEARASRGAVTPPIEQPLRRLHRQRFRQRPRRLGSADAECWIRAEAALAREPAEAAAA